MFQHLQKTRNHFIFLLIYAGPWISLGTTRFLCSIRHSLHAVEIESSARISPYGAIFPVYQRSALSQLVFRVSGIASQTHRFQMDAFFVSTRRALDTVWLNQFTFPPPSIANYSKRSQFATGQKWCLILHVSPADCRRSAECALPVDTEIRIQRGNRICIVGKLLIECHCPQIRAHHHHHRLGGTVYAFSINEISIIVRMELKSYVH